MRYLVLGIVGVFVVLVVALGVWTHRVDGDMKTVYDHDSHASRDATNISGNIAGNLVIRGS